MKVEVDLTGNISAGYQWEPSIEPSNVNYDRQNTTENGEFLYGGQSTTMFTYDDVSPDTELTFKYRRAWEDGVEPLHVVHVRVTN